MIFVILVIGALPAYGVPVSNHGPVIDLTHDFANGYTVSWPSATQYNFTVVFRGQNKAGGFWYEANDFTQAEHSGTHTDAPAHFAKDRWRIGDIPLERLIGPGVVIDITEKTK